MNETLSPAESTVTVQLPKDLAQRLGWLQREADPRILRNLVFETLSAYALEGDAPSDEQLNATILLFGFVNAL